MSKNLYKARYLVILFIILIGCKKESNKQTLATPDTTFGHYVQAFTSGVVSKNSNIEIHLAQPIDSTKKKKLSKLFDFSPSVKGETSLKNDNVVVFHPEKPLKSDEKYTVRFDLGAILEVEPEFRTMKFEFKTIKQYFDVQLNGLKSYEGSNGNLMQLNGTIVTADIDIDKATERVVTAKYDDKLVPLKWDHNKDANQHFFTIDSLQRDVDPKKLTISWNGKSLDIKNKGKEEIIIPAEGEFKILDTKVVEQPSQHIQVFFSDPISKNKDLTGLFKLQDSNEPRITIDGNIVKIWPKNRLDGEKELQIYEGIESVNYKRISESTSYIIEFNASQPQVRFVGKGIIIPQKDRLVIPFEAVSLQAVDIRVIQIFKDNVHQFFQSNQFGGNSQLKQVGRLVYKGRVDLLTDGNIKPHHWNTYKINLADFFEIEQGAIYRLEIAFKKDYALNDCNGENSNLQFIDVETKDNYNTEWDQPGWYDNYYYPNNYQWSERNNPCSDSYYIHSRFIQKNIFASELGIIAKEGKGHTMHFAITNLLNAKPEKSVEIALYNLQNQLIEKISTDKDGFAEVNLSKKPFFLVAQKDKQFGYLRLDDGSALSLSNFNVAGSEVQDGLKGFIYGIRDVRRPGDSLYVNLILESSIDEIKDGYPVVFNLYDPSGKIIERRVAAKHINGVYSFLTKTDKDAPTGNWHVEAKVGNATFSKRVRIETIKPNRLKVNLQLPDRPLGINDRILGFESNWLHGTPASGLKAKVDVMFRNTKTTFDGFEQYNFDNHTNNFNFNETTIYDGQLNQQGKATIPLNFKGLNNASGMLNMWLTSRVFESGGEFSTSIKKVKYAPFNTFIGLKMPASEDNWYKTDTNYQPEIVVVDQNGNPKSGENLQVKLYKIDWRWWWESNEENLAHYVTSSRYKPVLEWNFPNSKHKNILNLKVPFRSWEDNGRYLLWAKDLNSGHTTSLTFYMSKYGSWQADEMSENASMLSLRSDKKKYQLGEKVKITIPSSAKGRALVTIENGTRVSEIYWITTDDKESTFNIETKKDMAPNFFVHVSLIQPYGQTENDAPLRLYGVIPISVENEKTILKPVIETAKEFKPEKNYTVKVSEANNNKMTYTLAVVDEGLLGITNFVTPNPHATFYAHEALGVKTWDLYDFVAGAYGAKLEKAFAVGGDGALFETNKTEVNRFKPVVSYLGPFELRKGETKKHRLYMPNYIGEVRVMVVARHNNAYGSAEKNVSVKKDLMLLATAPRVLAPNDQFKIPIEVFALKKGLKNVSVTIKTNDLIRIEGSETKSVNFGNKDQKMVYFDAKASANSGIAKIEAVTTSGGEKSTYNIELEVRNPNQPIIVDRFKKVNGKDSWETSIEIPGNPADAEAWLEVSTFPPLNLSQHLERLIHYPYGCVEQITSSAFPQLYLKHLTEISPDQQEHIENNILETIKKLQTFQLPNGGMGYWPNSTTVSEWGTNYVGHFMLEAEKAGYSIESSFKNKWLSFQKTAAQNWNSNYSNQYQNYQVDYIQAYRLYTLALANEADLGAMNRLREKTDLEPMAAWRLAAAYVLAGQKNAAQQIVQGITEQIKPYNGNSGTFGSELRDRAMILETLTLLVDEENAFKLLKTISNEMTERSWLSTQTTSWCLLAASKYAKSYYNNDEGMNFTMNANGSKKNYKTKLPMVKLPVEINNNNNNNNNNSSISLDFENKSSNSNFVRLVTKGIPTGIDRDNDSENLLLDVSFKNMNGNVINPNEIAQGTDFKMVVTVKHPGILQSYQNLALNTLFPAGWEILNKRLSGFTSNQFEYQDIRDDKIYTFFDLKPNEQKTFEFLLNASYAGEYYLPPVSCEAMYDNSIRAKVGGRLVQIK